MKLLIKKFKSLENVELAIPAKIEGGNGQGKTTILEAIGFVLTGKNLDGKEFERVYDNRVDLHDAIADVSYFDNYGNEYQRIVKPIFQTSRSGIEEIKIKRSTECRKNGIVVNDFADEFQDFYKFGTDYFFNQKEDVQRSIFIDALKSKLPDYDVNAASLKLKELKKLQKVEVDAVKSLQGANKSTKNVVVPEISPEIEKSNAEFLALSRASNTEAIAEINKKNNESQSAYLKKKGELARAISDTEIQIAKVKASIESEKELLKKIQESKFEPKVAEPTEKLESAVNELTEGLARLSYFDSIEDYAKDNFSKNPVLVENAAKIREISERVFAATGEIEDKCPLSGNFCETAKLHSEEAAKIAFENTNKSNIEALKSQNRQSSKRK